MEKNFTFWKPLKRAPFKPFSPINLNKYPTRTKKEIRIIDTDPWGDQDRDGVPNFLDCRPSDKSKQDTKAWPYGRGQTRFKKITKKKFQLEPTDILIRTESIPKTHKSPITEEEVKEILEKTKLKAPGKTSKYPTEVIITSQPPMGQSVKDTFGQAFASGSIKLYTKPFKKPKKKMGYYKIGTLTLSEDATKKKYLYDVLPHEVGHQQRGHTMKDNKSGGFQRESEADEYAHKWRKEHEIEEQPGYRKTHTAYGRLSELLSSSKKIKRRLK